MKVKRALISVSDKTGIVALAEGLNRLEIEIVSTGGTAKILKESGLRITEISDYTGFPEIMDGRVKTLHPKVHGGLLARRENSDHVAVAAKNDIEMIDLLVVNLYPFRQVTADPNVDIAMAVENIDIGGPAMLRAGAKNYDHVAVLVDPGDYGEILSQLNQGDGIDQTTRERLAVKVFSHTAGYDAMVNSFLSRRLLEKETVHLSFTDGVELRYGENSHQKALFFKDPESSEESVALGTVLGGKAMSFNNYMDANAAFEAVKEFPKSTPAVSVIKHMNPCGLATGKTVAEALEKAWEGDPISAFGGVLAVNQTVDLEFAKFLKGDDRKHISYMVVNGKYVPQEVPSGKFVEVIVAPDFSKEAVDFLHKKGKNIRLLQSNSPGERDNKTFKAITGGMLVQDKDAQLQSKFETVTKASFPGSYEDLAQFSMIACKHTKSNAIVLAREYDPGQFQVMGMGAGQPNRVDSMRKLSLPKAMENLQREWEQKAITEDFDTWAKKEIGKMVLASDAFFPFDDTVREAALFGIRYIVQPGGSMRDGDSVTACDELGIAMALTGLRHFNH